MKFIQKLLGVATYSQLEESLNEIIVDLEHSRNELRKVCFDEMDKLNPTKDGEKIQRLLIQMNRDITASYEKEKVLREYIAQVKD